MNMRTIRLVAAMAACALGLSAFAAKTYNDGETISGIDDSTETSVTINGTVYVSGANTYSKGLLTMNKDSKLVLKPGETSATLSVSSFADGAFKGNTEIGEGVTVVILKNEWKMPFVNDNVMTINGRVSTKLTSGANVSDITFVNNVRGILAGTGVVRTPYLMVRDANNAGCGLEVRGGLSFWISQPNMCNRQWGYFKFGDCTLAMEGTNGAWDIDSEGSKAAITLSGTLTLDTTDKGDNTTARTITIGPKGSPFKDLDANHPGKVRAIGNGTAVFTYSPAWTGGTEANGGTLRFTANSVTHQGSVTVSGGRLEHPNAAPTVKGNLTLAGGTLALSAINRPVTVQGTTAATAETTLEIPVTAQTASGAYTLIAGFGSADISKIALAYDTTCGKTVTLEKSGSDLIAVIGEVLAWKGGDGDWSDANWKNGAGETVAWTDGCIADFTAAGGGTVTVASDVAPAGLKLSDGYAFTGAGTIKTSAVSVPDNATVTVAKVGDGDTFTKTGAGTLVLSETTAVATTVNVNAGTLALTGECGWGDVTVNVAGGATLGANGAATVALKSFKPAGGAALGTGLALSSGDIYGETAFSGQTIYVNGTWTLNTNGTSNKNYYFQSKGATFEGSGTLVAPSFGMSGGYSSAFKGVTLLATGNADGKWLIGRMWGRYSVSDVTFRMQGGDFKNYADSSGEITVADGTTLTIDTCDAADGTARTYTMNSDPYYNRIVSSKGCLRKVGKGTLDFRFDLPLTGASTVEGGILKFVSNCAAPLTVAVTAGGGADEAALAVSGSRTFSAAGGVTLGAGAALDLNDGTINTMTLAGPLAVAESAKASVNVQGANGDKIAFTGASGLSFAEGKTFTVSYALLANPRSNVPIALTSGAKISDEAKAKINDIVKTGTVTLDDEDVKERYEIAYGVANGELTVTFSATGDSQWTGQGADGNWSTEANWENGNVPDGGQALVFNVNAGLQSVNNLNTPSFPSLFFGANAGTFTLSGKALNLASGSLVNGSSAAQTLALDVASEGTLALSSPNGGSLVLRDATLSSATGNVEFADVPQTVAVEGTATITAANRFRTGNLTISGGETTVNAAVYPQGIGKTIRLAEHATVTLAKSVNWDSGVCFPNQSAFTVDEGATLNLEGMDTTGDSIHGSYGFQLHIDGTVNATGNVCVDADPVIDGAGTLNAIGGLYTRSGIGGDQPIFIHVSRINLGATGLKNDSNPRIYLDRVTRGGSGVATKTTFGPYDSDTQIQPDLYTAAGGTGLGFDTEDKDGTARTVTVSGQIRGNAAITKTGAGTLKFANGSSAEAAPLTVSAGTLSFQDDVAGGNAFNGLTVAAGATLAFDVTAAGADLLKTYAKGTVADGVTIDVKVGEGYKPGVYKLVSNVTATAAGLTLVMSGEGADATLLVADDAIYVRLDEPLPAGSVLWVGAGGDGNWSTDANWKDGAKPTAGTSYIYFDGTANCETVNDVQGLNPTKIIFRTGAGAFTLGGAEGVACSTVENASLAEQTVSLPLASVSGLTVGSTAKGIVLSGNQSAVSGALTLASGTLTLKDFTGAEITAMPAAVSFAGESSLPKVTFAPNSQTLAVAGDGPAAVVFADMTSYNSGSGFILPKGLTVRILKKADDWYWVSHGRSFYVNGALDIAGLGLAIQGSGSNGATGTGGTVEIKASTGSGDYAESVIDAKAVKVRGNATLNLSYTRVNFTGPEWFGEPWGVLNLRDGLTLGVKGTDTEAYQGENNCRMYVYGTVTVDTLDAGDKTTARTIVFHERVDGGYESDTLVKVGAGTLKFEKCGTGTYSSGEYLAKGTVRVEGGTLRFGNTCSATNLQVKAGGRLEMTKTVGGNNVTVAEGGVFAAVAGANIAFADAKMTLAAGAVISYDAKREGGQTVLTPVTFGAGASLVLPETGKVRIAFSDDTALVSGQEVTLVSGANLQADDLAKFELSGENVGTLSIVDGNLVFRRSVGMMIIVR